MHINDAQLKGRLKYSRVLVQKYGSFCYRATKVYLPLKTIEKGKSVIISLIYEPQKTITPLF